MLIQEFISGLIIREKVCEFTMADGVKFTGILADANQTDYLIKDIALQAGKLFLVSKRDITLLCEHTEESAQ
jgi:hypothetical protein